MMATCMERISSRLVADVIESVDSSSRWWLDLKICGFKLWMSIASPWMMIIIQHDPDLHIDPHDNDRAPVSLVDVVDVIVPEILGVLQHNVYLSYWEEHWEFLLFRKLYPLKDIKTEAAITEMSQTRQLNLRTCSNLLYLWTNEFLETNYIFTQLFSGWENQILPKEKSNVVKNCNSRDEKCKYLNFYWLNPLLDIWWDWYVVMLAGPILSQSFALVWYLGQAWILWEYWWRKFEEKNEKNGVWQKILPSPHHQVWWFDQDYWGGLISSRLTTPITLWLIARMFFSPFI